MTIARTHFLAGALRALLLGGVLLAPTLSRGAGTSPTPPPRVSQDVTLVGPEGADAVFRTHILEVSTPCVFGASKAGGIIAVCDWQAGRTTDTGPAATTH